MHTTHAAAPTTSAAYQYPSQDARARTKSNDLAMRVCVAAIGPCRDSRSNDRSRSDTRPRKDARHRQDARPRTDRRPQKVRGLQVSDDRSPWAESMVSKFLVRPSPDYQPGDEGSKMNAGQLSEVSVEPHYCRSLLNWTALAPPLMHYLSSRPYLTTILCLLATLYAQPRWTPLL